MLPRAEREYRQLILVKLSKGKVFVIDNLGVVQTLDTRAKVVVKTITKWPFGGINNLQEIIDNPWETKYSIVKYFDASQDQSRIH